jgi:hypothetical protein
MIGNDMYVWIEGKHVVKYIFFFYHIITEVTLQANHYSAKFCSKYPLNRLSETKSYNIIKQR